MRVTGRFFQEPKGSYFLFGPRGTGKSTWLKGRHPAALWIDLLRPELFRAYNARPERLGELLAAHRSADVVVIDEVQKAPQLLDVVHQRMEEPSAPQFVLTGSSARKLRATGVDLLGGRALLRRMHPFMAAELGADFDLTRSLRYGLIPLVVDSQDPASQLDAYVGLYLKEEVQAEGLVRSVENFARFLEVASFSHGATWNSSAVACDCEVSRKVTETYLSIVEDLLLAFRVPAFTRRAKRLVAVQPKFYFFDAGVYSALRPRGPLDRPEEIAGAALEGLVAQHLRAWVDYSGLRSDLRFWRTKSGQEVDFVLYGEDLFYAIEVTHARTLHSKDTRSLRSFRDDYPEATCLLLYGGTEVLEVQGIRCLPCERFLRALIPRQPFPTLG